MERLTRAHVVDTRPSLPSPLRRPGDEASVVHPIELYLE
jgi:hypothetical protein